MARFLTRCVHRAPQHRDLRRHRLAARPRCSTCSPSAIPDDERIVTIEDAAELQLQQPHVVSLETRPANIEGARRVHHPRSGAQRAAHAPRPHRRRRVPRRRGARHAAGDEHRPRRLADHHPRQLAARGHRPPRDAGADGRPRAAHARHPRADRRRHPPDRAAGALRRRLAQDHLDHRGGRHRATTARCASRTSSSSTALPSVRGKVLGEYRATGYMPSFLNEFITMGLCPDGQFL